MLRPRSRLGLFVRLGLALAGIALVSAAWIWNSGRVRLERALADLRACGGPELPPQGDEATEDGRKTEAWFAQFGDEDAWTREDLDTALAIDALPADVAGSLKVLTDALRVSEEQVAVKARELGRPDAIERKLSELLGTDSVDARSSLEFERTYDLRKRVDELLKKQEPLERWDDVARAWIRSRTLAHPRVLARANELFALGPFDPPAQRGFKRFDLRYQNRATETQQVLLEALPELALEEDRARFAKAAHASLALGRMRARCWGLVAWKMDAWARMRASWAIRACLRFLPPGVDLREIEDAVAAPSYRVEGLEALRRERAVGNEVFVDFRAGMVESARVVDGNSLLQRELVRLWLGHEQAGYLEMLTRAIELAGRAPYELPAGLKPFDEIVDDLGPRRPWNVLRSTITPDLRREALGLAELEVEQQLTELCFAAWRDPESIVARLAATKDPFTGKPLKMREEDGVLVFWSVGEDLHDDEPAAEHGDDIVARFRPR